MARGDVLVAPGHPHHGRFLNARLRILFHAGSAVQEARLWSLDVFDLTEAGEIAWAQLELPEPRA